jgi:hypothetical protein
LGQVDALVPLGRDDQGAARLRVPDRAPLGGPDGPLSLVVEAVEQPRIGEIGVVGDVDAVRGRPHEGEDHHLREEEPSSFDVLTPAIFTLGATPTMPMPLAAAAIVPAVCVPCPFRSLPGSSGVGVPLEQSALRLAS